MSQDHSNSSREIFLTSICGLSLALGAIAEFSSFLPEGIAFYSYIISYISGGYSGVKETFSHLRKFEINIDFLMIAAATGAAFLDAWIEGAILLFLFSLSGALESYALGKSRNAIHSLLELRPSQALRRTDDGTEELVPIEELNVGEIVIVKPGEHIPIDGKIVKGESTIDQSTITGESIPVAKAVGDDVFAATLNENGVIEIEVSKPAKDTTLSRIIDMVESAQKSKAKTQRFLENFEPRYAVTVVVSVILLIFIPWLVFDQPFDPTFYRAMTVLVVASPCALIISTPASIISAIANGAKSGVLFKGGSYIEQTAEIDTIAFDKTGTLTQGKPEVTDWISFNKDSNTLSNKESDIKHLVALAAGCEIHSEHHLAEAIGESAKRMNIRPYPVSNMQASPGKGVQAEWDGKLAAVGNSKMFEEKMEHWAKSLTDRASELRTKGNTVVFVLEDNEPKGLIALADKVRPKAKETLQKLRDLGISHIAMLTGDNQGVADAIAQELGIDDIYADLLPDQKMEKIEEMKKRGSVAMVGDGVNDAPALAVANLGIAMGAAGTDVALETADIVLMGDDLTKLPYLLKLSRKSKKVVIQNIIFSLAVIVMLLCGVFFIDLPLTLGVIGHEGSTLIVVMNGVRLLWY